MKLGLQNSFRTRLGYLLERPENSRSGTIEKLGISNVTMTNWLSGGGIDDEYLFPLADVLSVPWVWLKHGDAMYKKSCQDYIDNLYAEDVKEANHKAKVLEGVLKCITDEVYVIDDNNKFVFVSEAATLNLGYSYTEIFKMSPFDVKPALDSQEFTSMKSAVLSCKDTIKFKSQHKKRDGSLYDVDVMFKKIKLDPPFYIAVARKLSGA